MITAQMSLADALAELTKATGVAISAGQQNAFNSVQRATLIAVEARAEDLKPTLAQKFSNLISTVKWIDHEPNRAHAAALLDALIKINGLLKGNPTRLDAALTVAQWTAFAAACAAAPATSKPHVQQFCEKRNGDVALYLGTCHKTAADEGLGDHVIPVVVAVMRELGEPSGITSMTIANFCRAFRDFGPNKKFTGFVQWGPGNHGDADANVRGHALKHVCRDMTTAELLEYGEDEAVICWEKLKISVSIGEYKAHAKKSTPAKLACFDGTKPLSGLNLRKFLVLRGLQEEPDLRDFVLQQALAPYRKYALDQSKVLTHIRVKSDGTKVFIAGSHDDAYIIGRYEGDVLGISSCYWPKNMSDKHAADDKTKGWILAENTV